MKKSILAFLLISQLQSVAQVTPVCFKTLTTTPSVGTYPESVCSADFNADGKADLAVANLNSNNVSVLIGNGNGTFLTAVNYSTGAQPRCVVSADFNGDNKPDLAVSNSSGSPGFISVFLGGGTGTFGPVTNFSVANGSQALVAGDFNSDSKMDLAVTICNTGNVAILLGNGSGSFATPVNYSIGGCAFDITTADFNADGKLDLAVPIVGNNPAVVRALAGNGNGTFATFTSYTLTAVLSTPYGVTTGDYDNDGKIDLAVGKNGTFNTLDVLTGTGTGSFSPAVSYTTTASSGDSMLSADFNSDGNTDIAITELQSCKVFVFLGLGNGSFTTAVGFATGCSPRSLAKGDFNSDGKMDLASGADNLNNVSILLNTIVPSVSITTSNSSICKGNSTTLTATGANTFTWNTNSTNTTISVSPSVTLSYSVIGKSIDGCTNTAISNVSVNPIPTISVNSGSVCSGQNFVVSPSGASAYTITGGNFTVNPASNSSYSVTGTSSSGCASASVAVCNITVNPSPTVSAFSSTNNLCIGENATLTASGANTYTWSNNTQANTVIISPTITTTYSITGTNSFGCNNTSSFTQSVTDCSTPTGFAAANTNDTKYLTVYPNPTSGLFTIDSKTEVSIKITDIFGKLVLTTKLQECKNEIDLSAQACGIYFIHTENITFKIVKQ